jgi:hypothetical protein
MITPMNTRRQRIPLSDLAKQALAEIGGEPLQGSGFEDEAPEEGFSESEPAPEPAR